MNTIMIITSHDAVEMDGLISATSLVKIQHLFNCTMMMGKLSCRLVIMYNVHLTFNSAIKSTSLC